MADVGQIPSAPCQIQPTKPFAISSADLFCTDCDIPVKEAYAPSATDDEVDCNTSIDYDSAIPSRGGVNRQDVQCTHGINLEVGAIISFRDLSDG